MMPLVALILATHLIAGSAASIPQFDIVKSCKAEADDSAGMATCIRDENDARDQLKAEWSSFDSTDKPNCRNETSEDSTPSYVELLTCLEMARDARKMRSR